LLEDRQRAGHRGRRAAELAAGCSEAAFIEDGDEDRELVEAIHDSSITRKAELRAAALWPGRCGSYTSVRRRSIPIHQDHAVTASTIVIHGTVLSGHTHRVENFLTMLGIPYRLAHTPAEARQTPEFLALNPLAQIPVLEDGELVLAD